MCFRYWRSFGPRWQPSPPRAHFILRCSQHQLQDCRVITTHKIPWPHRYNFARHSAGPHLHRPIPLHSAHLTQLGLRWERPHQSFRRSGLQVCSQCTHFLGCNLFMPPDWGFVNRGQKGPLAPALEIFGTRKTSVFSTKAQSRFALLRVFWDHCAHTIFFTCRFQYTACRLPNISSHSELRCFAVCVVAQKQREQILATIRRKMYDCPKQRRFVNFDGPRIWRSL